MLLPFEAVLTLMRDASRTPRPATWWYDCISHLARGDRHGILDRSRFPNNAVIPLEDGSLHIVSDGDRRLVCLPADEAELPLQVPRVFASVFSFLDASLATLLYGGEISVLDWFVDRYRIIRFEVTDLIPRAIRATVQTLFSGEVPLTPADLSEVWSFVRNAGQEVRQITDQKFWDEVGRLPLPINSVEIVSDNAGDSIPPSSLVPAFLAFWPEPLCKSRALDGVFAERRISQTFLDILQALTNEPVTWRRLLNTVGVAENPVVRRDRRVAVGGQDLLLRHSRSETRKSGYSGERQQDENRVIVDALSTEPWWREFERRIEPCNHDATKVLQSLEFLDGLSACSQIGEEEHANGIITWIERLRDCIEGIGVETGEHADSVLCRGGSATGHVVSAPSYSRMQLRGCRFLPTSRGPRSVGESFSRLVSQRLISSGTSNEEIGDSSCRTW
jgi:hypothetical protein